MHIDLQQIMTTLLLQLLLKNIQPKLLRTLKIITKTAEKKQFYF